MSRTFETTAASADGMTTQERRRRNHPVFDVGRTVGRTYRDLLVFEDRGATLAELHAEGFNRFTAAARHAALDVLLSSGHAEPVEVVRTFAPTATTQGMARHVTVYRLTAEGIAHAQTLLSNHDLDRVAARRLHHGIVASPAGGQGVTVDEGTIEESQKNERACEECCQTQCSGLDRGLCEAIRPLGFDRVTQARVSRTYRRMAAPGAGFHASFIREFMRVTAGQRDAVLARLESIGAAECDHYGNWFFLADALTQRGNAK